MILQLATFDYLTASPVRLVSSGPLWEGLPRLSRGLPAARLLIVADTLRKEDILEGFRACATPEAYLPPGALAVRLDYEDFLRAHVQSVRYTRVYLVLDPLLDEEAVIGLLRAYGLEARRLDHELPRPFDRARVFWDHLRASDGRYLGLLRSKNNQYGRILHPQTLHLLLGQDFPLWVVLEIGAFSAGKTAETLRVKGAMARYSEGKTEESQHESALAMQGVQAIREAVARGESLHAVRLYALVDGETLAECREREEIVLGTTGLEMERVYGAGGEVLDLFSGSVRPRPRLLPGGERFDGAPMTTSGVALLAGSALSYRRRTETRGVMLGVDRNQAPVILNLFDDRASYNMVILGQTGSGKTFATQLLMLRHLLLGVRLVILDPQGNVDWSFLGAEVYQRSVLGTAQASVNVLDVVQEEIGAQVEMAISLLRLLGVHSNQAVERALLDEALLELYAPGWGREESPSPTLTALQARLEQRVGRSVSPLVRETAERLTLSLGVYTHGSQADFFGKPTSVDFRLDHAVNVFDVSRLPHQGMGGGLRTALLSILVANINQGIRRRRRRGDRAPILFFVDEMGILMRDAVIAQYISYEYKTARARLVGMIVADQDLHSLLGPCDEHGLHHGVPILANSAHTLLFNQKDSERARVREHFPSLPEKVVDVLPVLPRGACAALFPDDLLIVSVLPSELERVVFSSRLQDRQRAQQIVYELREELYERERSLA